MGGVGTVSILHKKKTVSVVAIVALTVMLLSSVVAMYSAEAKSKNKAGV
jgi:hypothetical protein